MLAKGIRDVQAEINGSGSRSAAARGNAGSFHASGIPSAVEQGAGPCCRQSAFFWAAWGFPVFRLGEGIKEAAGLAFTQPGFAFTDPREIEKNFPAGRGFNIGYRTGHTPTSNTVVIDLDVKGGRRGPETLIRAANTRAGGDTLFADLARIARATGAMLVSTPSGGFHFIWSGRDLREISQSSARWLEKFGQDCGVDVRAHNGYALAPGSWLPGQGRYKLLSCPMPGEGLGSVPEWIVPLLITRDERRRGALTVEGKNGTAAIRLNGVLVSGPGSDCQGSRGWSAATIEDARRHILDKRLWAPRGQRNNKGFQVAAFLRRDMAFGYLLARELMEVWAEGNSEEPLAAHELDLLTRQGATGTRALGAGNWEALYGGMDVKLGSEGSEGSEGSNPGPGALIGAGPEEIKGVKTAFGDNQVSSSTRALIVNEGRPRFIEKERPFWPGFLDRGYFTLLTGERKIGKSQFLFWLAATVSKGGPWAVKGKGGGSDGGADGEGDENERARAGDVYLLTCEDDYAKKIVPRLAAYGADFRNIIHIEGTKGEDGKLSWFNLQSDLELLGAKMKARAAERAAKGEGSKGEGIRGELLIIDPVSGYTGKTKVNDEGEVRAAIQGLNRFAADWDICLIGLRHPRKAAGATGDRTSGSHAWEDVPRRVYELQIDEEDESEDRWNRKRFLFNTHYQYGKPADALVFGIREKVVDVSLPGDSPHFQTLSVLEFEQETSEITPEENYKRRRARQNEEINPEKTDDSALQKAKSWVLDELVNCTHMEANQMLARAAEAGHRRNTLERARRSLISEKLIHKKQEKNENNQNEWRWKITELGIQRVKGLPGAAP